LLGFDAVLSLRPLPVRNCSGNTWSQGRPLTSGEHWSKYN